MKKLTKDIEFARSLSSQVYARQVYQKQHIEQLQAVVAHQKSLLELLIIISLSFPAGFLIASFAEKVARGR